MNESSTGIEGLGLSVLHRLQLPFIERGLCLCENDESCEHGKNSKNSENDRNIKKGSSYKL